MRETNQNSYHYQQAYFDPMISFVKKPEADEERMKLDTLLLLVKSIGLSETKISQIKNTLM